MPYAIHKQVSDPTLALHERGPLVTMVANIAELDEWMLTDDRHTTHTYSGATQAEYDAWLAAQSQSRQSENAEAIKATAKQIGATHLERTAVGLFLVRYNEADAVWESLPIRNDGALYHDDWTADAGLNRDNLICLNRGESLAAQQQVVDRVWMDYQKRVGYREYNFITHFEWISDTEFRVYQACRSYAHMNLLMELAGREPSEDDRPEKFFKSRVMAITCEWGNGWELTPVEQVDLLKLIPVDSNPNRLIIQRWHSAIIFDLLSEIRDMATGGLVQRQTNAIALTIDDVAARCRDDRAPHFATIKDFLLGATPEKRGDRRRNRKASAASSLDNYPVLLTEIFAAGDQSILAAIIREAADHVCWSRY